MNAAALFADRGLDVMALCCIVVIGWGLLTLRRLDRDAERRHETERHPSGQW